MRRRAVVQGILGIGASDERAVLAAFLTGVATRWLTRV